MAGRVFALPVILVAGLAVAQPAPESRGGEQGTRTQTTTETTTETRTTQQGTALPPDNSGGAATAIDLDDPEARLQAREVRGRSAAQAFPTDAAPTPGRVGLRETPLRISNEPTTQTPANWTGDIEGRGYDEPAWISETQIRQRKFIQPFLTSRVAPEFAARLWTMGGVPGGSSAASFQQMLFLSAYALELYAPTLVYRDSSTFDTGHYRVNLKLPAFIGDHHAIALLFGTELPLQGPFTADAGIRSMIGYSYGSELFSAQARIGYGKDRLVGEFDQPFRTALFYDAAAAVFLGDHFSLQAQVDGRRDMGPGNAIRIFPGVRWFPLELHSLSVGASGLWWTTQDATGDWSTTQAGAFVDLGYQFF